MTESIKFQDILLIVRKRFLLILSVTFLSVLMTGIVSYFFLTPVYESSTQLLINQTATGQQAGTTINVQENLELINTYRVIIKSPAILDLVMEEVEVNKTLKELSKQISISNEQNSQVVTITVQDKNLKNAVKIANTIAGVFQNEIPVIMNIDNVTILSMANEEMSKEPVSPRPIFNMLIAFTASLLAMIGIVLLLEYFDDTVKSENQIKALLELPVLGSIPMKNMNDLHLQKPGRGNSQKRGVKRLWEYGDFFKRKK